MRFFLIGLLLIGVPVGAVSAQSVEQEIERLLEAVGGRETWADATGFTMSEILHTDSQELPVFRRYWVDFETPRIREEAVGRGFRQINTLNGDGGWTWRNGELRVWSEEQVAGWRSFWPGIPTRVFSLLARGAPSVTPSLERGVIDIEIGGERVVWIGTDT